MSKSIGSARARKARPDRPPKPYPDFPLTPHASGKWMKKIRGSIYYFGTWGRRVDGKLVRVPGDGWEEALAAYKAQADDLHAGRTPRADKDGLTVADLCNRFLTAKLRKVEAGEIGRRMFAEYKEITDLLVSNFGKTRLVDDLAADDFEALRAKMARAWGPVRLGNAVGRVRSVFKYGTDNGLIDRAVRFGSEFRKPDRAVLRRHRAKGGERLFDPPQLRRLLAALEGKEVETGRTNDAGEPEKVKLDPNPQLRAMVLLGANCGFGNKDVATLPLGALALDAGWVNFPRPKTGIPRRCPLWPETVEALKAVIPARTKPAGYAECGLVFLTPEGLSWVRHQQTAKQKSSNIDKVAVEFLKLTKRVGLHRDGLGFYSLRHTFRTVADATRDQPAADAIMGHADPGMRAHYVERIEDERLKAVMDHVRRWLFGQS